MVKTFVQRLAAEALSAHTGDGCAYVVGLIRAAEDDLPEAYERLARSIPLGMLRIPGIPTLAELGPEALETPWLMVLHDDGAMIVPLCSLCAR